jgi:hypothetical protein
MKEIRNKRTKAEITRINREEINEKIKKNKEEKKVRQERSKRRTKEHR